MNTEEIVYLFKPDYVLMIANCTQLFVFYCLLTCSDIYSAAECLIINFILRSCAINTIAVL